MLALVSCQSLLPRFCRQQGTSLHPLAIAPVSPPLRLCAVVITISMLRRRRVLKAFGWTMISVPYYDWYGMDNPSIKVRAQRGST